MAQITAVLINERRDVVSNQDRLDFSNHDSMSSVVHFSIDRTKQVCLRIRQVRHPVIILEPCAISEFIFAFEKTAECVRNVDMLMMKEVNTKWRTRFQNRVNTCRAIYTDKHGRGLRCHRGDRGSRDATFFVIFDSGDNRHTCRETSHGILEKGYEVRR